MTASDDNLRSRYAALRRADASAAPELDALLARPVTTARRRVIFPAAIAAAAAILLIAGVQLTKNGPSLEVSVSAEEPSILEWRSPTASLLAPQGNDLIQPAFTPTASLLRGARVDLNATLHSGR